MSAHCDECKKADTLLRRFLVSYEDAANALRLDIIADPEDEGTKGHECYQIPLRAIADINAADTCPSCADLVQFQHLFNASNVERFNLLVMCGSGNVFIRPKTELKIPSKLLDPLPFSTAEHNENEHAVGSKRYIVDKHLFDTDLARDWLMDCDQNHAHCKPPSSLKIEVQKLLLVDVVDECIVSLQPRTIKFAALSYVWGHCETIKTTSTNINSLKRIRSLSRSSPQAVIPRTIRDAMRLTAKLGLRYLWVDCLSIIQDDPHVSRYLNAMGQIYANAYVTLIAANGKDAEYGIRGLTADGPPRTFFGHVIRLPSFQLKLRHVKDVYNFSQIHRAPWSDRAWTFQEGFFSNRALIFADQMAFLCRASYHEESAINRRGNWPVQSKLEHICQLSRENLAWPKYANLVEAFNARTLSFEADVVDAFAGVMTHFAGAEDIKLGYEFVSTADRQHQRQFIFGHPIELSAGSFLWRGEHGGTLRRRYFEKSRTHDLIVPSWSWLAWHGALSLEDWERDIKLFGNIQKYCSLCDGCSALHEVCCVQENDVGISKYSPCVSIYTEHARFHIMYPRNSTDAGIVDSGDQIRAVGEVQFDHALSVDLREEDPCPWTTPSGLLISSRCYDFIAIGTGRRGFRRMDEWQRKDSRDDSGIYVYALCINWKIGRVEGLAERMGVAVIEKEVWTAASKRKLEVILE